MNVRRVIFPALLTLSITCSLPFLFGLKPLESGAVAPDFSLSSLEGETVSRADFAGRPLLLNFWNPT